MTLKVSTATKRYKL